MYKKANLGWLKHWDFMILDLICLQVAFISAYFIRHGVHLAYENKLYRNMAFVLFLIQVCVTSFGESFKNVLKRGYYKEFTATFKHVCQIILIAVFYLFATQTGEGYSRITLVLTGIIYAVISYIARILWKKYLKAKGVAGMGNRSLLIITSEEIMDTVIDNIRNNNYEGFQIIGITLLDADRVGETINDVPVVATLGNVEEYVCREWVDEVFLDLPKEVPLPRDLFNDFIEMGITVHLKLIEMAKLDHDPRIIGGDKGIGGFIRKYSIDEFPQFWNVLKGDSDIIGTTKKNLDFTRVSLA